MPSRKACIISVAIGHEYPRQQDQLEASLNEVGCTADRLYWRNRLPPGSPAHRQIPYAFKVHAFRFAQASRYTQILWLDASLKAVRPLEPIFERIRSDGYFLPLNGTWRTGQWCSDAALSRFGKTREEAMEYPQTMSGCIGLNLEHPLGLAFLDQWFEKATDGISFPGAWNNNDGAVSTDIRVLGHRHDQTAASFIAWDLGMRRWDDHVIEYQHKDRPHPDAFFVIRSPFPWWKYRFAVRRRQLMMSRQVPLHRVPASLLRRDE